MGTTQNIGLSTTPESTNKVFKTWRMEMDGETDSNMTKIDEAFGSVNTALGGKAPSTHNHNASDINAGTLPVARGGTGETTMDDLAAAVAGAWTKAVNETIRLTGKSGVSSSRLMVDATKDALGRVTMSFYPLSGDTVYFSTTQAEAVFSLPAALIPHQYSAPFFGVMYFDHGDAANPPQFFHGRADVMYGTADGTPYGELRLFDIPSSLRDGSKKIGLAGLVVYYAADGRIEYGSL